MKRIIVDVMGGDRSPAEAIKGAYLASLEADIDIIFVGDAQQIECIAKENNISLDGFEIVHSGSVIEMTDDPMCVTRSKSDSSMSTGLSLLAEGKGDAFVSSGNTGALFTGANLMVRKIKGLRRPAIAAMLPMQPPVLLLDSGANVSVTAEYLEQFAVMGTVYMKKLMGLSAPRVGLLNNGIEECKGTPIQISAYKLLSENEDLNFVGNVEANKVMQNACDVLVTDGFTGNIFLKSVEGMGKLMLKTMKGLFKANFKTMIAAALVKNGIGDMKKNFDVSEFGGAPILGINKPVIKAHGSSDAKSFKSAIKQASYCAENDLTGDMAKALAELAKKKKAERQITED